MFQIVQVTDELGRVTMRVVFVPANDNSVEALTDPNWLEAA
jgi:hypothetical protein